MSKNIFAMFPGQGSQFVGMGRYLLNEFPLSRQTFEEASDAVGVAIQKLCLYGPDDQLKLTENTQPCILTLSVAMWRVLQAETGVEVQAFAGHSLGEYSALVAAGRLEFPKAVQLVKIRGAAMQEAVPAGVGAMAAVLRFKSGTEVEEWCRKASRPDCMVQPANFNSPEQLVISGHLKAVDQVVEIAKAQGAICKKLPVSAPFHCSLMTPAREVMRHALASVSLRPQSSLFIPNVTAEPSDRYQVEFLIEQVTGAVRWTQTMEASDKAGHDLFLEVGPGKVLSGLFKKTVKRENAAVAAMDEEGLGQFIRAR